MNRIFLSNSLMLASGLLFGQGTVVVQVLSPESITAPYSNVYAVEASGWGVPDLTVPSNAVQDTLWLVNDGTTADSLGCEPLVNGADVAGKIAVVYRGSCPFSQKALNAQNAGAVAVLLFNNSDDQAINMQGGDLGPSVTIPVVMISQTSGAVIRPVLDVEPVTAFIGNNFGAFPNNLHIDVEDLLVPSAASVPSLIASGPSEYQVQLGAFIHNYGSATQTTARLRAMVTQDGNELYNEVSQNQTLAPGDSLFVELPQFDQPAYSGRYAITYTVEFDGTDGYTEDDAFTVPLVFNDVFSYVPTDETTGLPLGELYFRPAESQGSYRTCIQFSDTNASRLAVTGLYFSAVTPEDLSEPFDSVLTDLLVTSYAFLWTDAIDNAFTVPTDGGLTLLSPGSYSYTEDLQEENVFVPFDEVLTLEDNQRYLFCVETSDPIVFQGWNEDVDYTTNAQFFIDPTSVIRNGTDWFNGFAGQPGGPAIGLQTIDATTIGITENADRVDITPYPNPTADFLSIPMKDFTGPATLEMFNLNGAKVAEQKVAVGGNGVVIVDVTTISAGTYLFHMEFENGTRSDFRVVVAK